MKKILAFLFTIIITICSVFTFSGCRLFGFNETDESASKKKMEQLLTTVKNGDKAEIKSLFALDKIADIEDFDRDIDDLLFYYDGKFETFKGVSGTNDYKDHGLVTKHYNMSYDVTTSQTVYRFAIIWYVEDTGNANNIGIWSLNVIKFADDPNQDSSYGGDGSWTNGIHLGEPYAFSYLGEFLKSIQSKDINACKSHFASNKITDEKALEDNINSLIDYYDGYDNGFHSNKKIKRTDSKNGNEETCFYELSYDITTTEKDNINSIVGRYRICAKLCAKDTVNKKNIGIVSFYIKEEKGEFADNTPYWGDGLWTDGINIGKIYQGEW